MATPSVTKAAKSKSSMQRPRDAVRTGRRTQAATGATTGEEARDSSAAAGKVRVLERGLTVLRVFTPRNDWLSNHEIATAAGLPRPTVSRLAANLSEMGYLEPSRNRGQYRLGPSVLSLGYAALAHTDVIEIARPHLARFAEQEDALMVLATRDGLSMVCNEVFLSDAMLTLRLNVGSRLPLLKSAVGGALIGVLPEGEKDELLREVRAKYAAEWSELEPTFRSASAQMAGKGYFTSIGTLEHGVNGLGVVLELPSAPRKYVIGMAGPSVRFGRKLLEQEIAPRLLALKAMIEREAAAIESPGETTWHDAR